MPTVREEQEQEEQKELEQFAKDYQESRELGDGVVDDHEEEAKTREASTEETTETTTATEETSETSTETKETTAADQTEDLSQTVTLADDKEAFGELAGKKITVQQLQEAGLLKKLVTWGHQGRHFTQKNQEELEETKKMRALLEEQLGMTKEDRERAAAAAEAGPKLNPEQAADALVGHYGTRFKELADAGAIESGFFDTYPKVAAQIEERFQSGATLLTSLIGVIDEMKTRQDQRVDVDTTTASGNHLESTLDTVAKKGDLFEHLGNDEHREGFMKWATSEESTLRWVDKEADKVTTSDVEASFLLYVHQHPDQFKKRKQVTEEERQQAGGGGAGADTASRKAASLDDMAQFEKDLKDSQVEVEY